MEMQEKLISFQVTEEFLSGCLQRLREEPLYNLHIYASIV